MSRQVIASDEGTRDINCTCDVLHVARAAQFNSSDVIKKIVAAQGLLATGAAVPDSQDNVYGDSVGTAWLGEASSDVMSCSWSKDIDGVVGALSVQLKQRPGESRYLETILPGDLLFVFMSDVGNYDIDNRFAGTLVTIAIVDRVAESTIVQQMATVDVVNVSARDFSIVFTESSTVFDQAFAQIENAAYTGDYINQLFNDNKQLGLSPLENVLTLILLLYDADKTGSESARLQWRLTASADSTSTTQLMSIMDVTTYVQNPLPFYALAEPPGIVQAGNVWSLLESYSNPVLNEFFVDVRDVNAQERNYRAQASASAKADFFLGNTFDLDQQHITINEVLQSKLFRSSTKQQDGTSVLALVMRQRPYDSDAFSALPVTEVDVSEVESSEFARSSHDVLNWFRLRFPGLDVKHQEVVAGVYGVSTSIAKFGYRRMDAETRYMFTSSEASVTFSKDSTKADFGDVFRAYVELLVRWYGQNEVWYAGSMTMRFRPSIRIGTRLRLTRRGQIYDFYVQGVQHAFHKEPGASRTSLTLTRGRVVSDATIPPVRPDIFQHDGFVVGDPVQ